VPKDAVSGVRAPLTGYASLNQIIVHDFQYILSEVVGGKQRKFQIATLQQAISIYRLFTRIASMNSNYYHHLELSISQEAHHDLKKKERRGGGKKFFLFSNLLAFNSKLSLIIIFLSNYLMKNSNF
jgi:hypothetical protein